jgi:hypothetical protein
MARLREELWLLALLACVALAGGALWRLHPGRSASPRRAGRGPHTRPSGPVAGDSSDPPEVELPGVEIHAETQSVPG